MSTIPELLDNYEQVRLESLTAFTNKGATVVPTMGFSMFPAIIDSIPTGEEPIDEGEGPWIVRYIDHTGKVIKRYHVATGATISTNPTPPDYTANGLVFQAWNHTAADLTNIKHDMNVGATYKTIDDLTHIYININAVGGKSVTLKLGMVVSDTVDVDWGDGVITHQAVITGNITITAHVYANYGDYIIKIGTATNKTFYLGHGSNTNPLISTSAAVRQGVTKIYLGKYCLGFSGYGLNEFQKLTEIVIPETATAGIGASAFSACYSIEAAVIPKTFPATGLNQGSELIMPNVLAKLSYGAHHTILGNSFMNGLKDELIVVPDLVTSMGQYCFCNGPAKRVVIGSGVTSINTYALAYMYSLAELYLFPTTPPSMANVNALTGIPSMCKIKVPAASLSNYKVATNWSTYANQMEGF